LSINSAAQAGTPQLAFNSQISSSLRKTAADSAVAALDSSPVQERLKELGASAAARNLD